MNDERGMSQLHVDIPKEMAKDLKEALPEKGMISMVVRRLLREFLAEVKAGKKFSNIFDKEGG